ERRRCCMAKAPGTAPARADDKRLKGRHAKEKDTGAARTRRQAAHDPALRESRHACGRSPGSRADA
ncbi:UNVERIFIED_CONTAM: hypothetical protein DQE83_28955, partial [Escherichia coli]